jgi:uncharacterized LabA/DUF88 family protein
MQKVAIFVDVQNIYYTTKSVFSKQFNYRKLWRELDQQYDIVTAIAYAIDRGDTKQEKFQQALQHIGFNVKLKPFIQRADGSAKGDWDVGITIDIMCVSAGVDKVILLSGDGDFAILMHKIKEMYNTETLVYSVDKLTAKSLIDSCDEYHNITSTYLL